jgi:uncharacterized protein
MPPLSLLIKPASSLCNLRCHYCFYHSLSSGRSIASYGLMTEEVQEAIVRRAFAEADGQLTLAFQGGEPTLCGLGFYRRLITLVAQYNIKKIPVQYALQTNGQVIDADWARFLAEHRFLVGLSLDGYKDLHDSLRVDGRGKGSHRQVLQAAALFDTYKVDYNILTVISDRLARHADKIYRFYEKNHFQYLQFIPFLAPLDADPGEDPHALSPGRYADFLLRLFDLWYADITRGQPVSIRLFDNWVRMLSGERPEQCGLTGVCTCQLVIESDGGVYPCDFYVTDEWRLGSVLTDRLEDLVQSDKARLFVGQSQPVPADCRDCHWYPLCRNGCRRDRETDGMTAGLNRFCTAYKTFFEQAYPRLDNLARQWRQMRDGGRSPVAGPFPDASPDSRGGPA